MCFPGAQAAAGFGLQAATSLASYQSGQEQWAAQEGRYNQNTQDALAMDRDQQDSLTEREMQEQGATSQSEHMALVEGAEKSAQVVASSAAGGVAGNDVATLVNGVGQQVREKTETLNQNWQNTASQLQSQKNAETQETQMEISEVAQPQDPSFASTAIGIAGDAIGASASKSGQAGISAVGAAGASASPDMALLGGSGLGFAG